MAYKIHIKRIAIFFVMLLCVMGFILFFPLSVDAASCTREKPDQAPDLYQINTTNTTATLYFTPVNNAVTDYAIYYGFERGEDRYYVTFPYGPSDGAITYTINHLSPNSRYFFRVRADNGCRHGYWSDTLSARTNWVFKVYTRVK